MKQTSLIWMLLGAFLALGVPAARATAQGVGTVRGVVRDSTSQQGVPGAQVALVGSNRSVSTDVSGAFVIAGVPEGSAVLRIQKIGFAQLTSRVSVSSGATVTQDIMLQPVITTLSQVVVVGYGSSNRADVTGALTTVAVNQIQGTPIAGVDGMLSGKAVVGRPTTG